MTVSKATISPSQAVAAAAAVADRPGCVAAVGEDRPECDPGTPGIEAIGVDPMPPRAGSDSRPTSATWSRSSPTSRSASGASTRRPDRYGPPG